MAWADPPPKKDILDTLKKPQKTAQLSGRCILLCYVVSVSPGKGADQPAVSHVCPCQHRIPVGQVGWKMRGRIDPQSVCRFMAISGQTTTTTVHCVLHSGAKYPGRQTRTPLLHLSPQNLHYSHRSSRQDIKWPMRRVEPDTVALIFNPYLIFL